MAPPLHPPPSTPTTTPPRAPVRQTPVEMSHWHASAVRAAEKGDRSQRTLLSLACWPALQGPLLSLIAEVAPEVLEAAAMAARLRSAGTTIAGSGAELAVSIAVGLETDRVSDSAGAGGPALVRQDSSQPRALPDSMPTTCMHPSTAAMVQPIALTYAEWMALCCGNNVEGDVVQILALAAVAGMQAAVTPGAATSAAASNFPAPWQPPARVILAAAERTINWWANAAREDAHRPDHHRRGSGASTGAGGRRRGHGHDGSRVHRDGGQGVGSRTPQPTGAMGLIDSDEEDGHATAAG
jgi:hypothetical protein